MVIPGYMAPRRCRDRRWTVDLAPAVLSACVRLPICGLYAGRISSGLASPAACVFALVVAIVAKGAEAGIAGPLAVVAATRHHRRWQRRIRLLPPEMGMGYSVVERQRDTSSPLPRLAVLLSGTGRTLENLLHVTELGLLPARIVAVVSSRPGVRGVAVARAARVPVQVVARQDFSDDSAFSAAIYDALAPAMPDWLVLAGFSRRLIVRPEWWGRIVNVHPSLLPSFGGRGMYGIHVHEAALAYGVKLSGCTVHFVDNEYDHGPVILQRAVPVLDSDDPAALAERVFAAECLAYPEALRGLIAGGVQVHGRRVRWDLAWSEREAATD